MLSVKSYNILKVPFIIFKFDNKLWHLANIQLFDDGNNDGIIKV